MIARRVEDAYDMGCRSFLCGMAHGCDFYFAEAVLALREQKPDVRLTALIPCPGQAKNWKKPTRERYEMLCSRCDSREILEPEYTPGCMLRRNRTMVSRAQVLISVYDGGSGGTGSTVRCAEQRGLAILPVWL